MKKTMVLLVLGIIVLSFTVSSEGQENIAPPASAEPASGLNVVVNGALDLDCKVVRTPPDKVGTDVENMYDITLDYPSNVAANPTPYIIMFLINDREWTGVRDQRLPYKHTINLKGLNDGEATVQVNVEDNSNNGAVLASAVVRVNVQH